MMHGAPSSRSFSKNKRHRKIVSIGSLEFYFIFFTEKNLPKTLNRNDNFDHLTVWWGSDPNVKAFITASTLFSFYTTI